MGCGGAPPVRPRRPRPPPVDRRRRVDRQGDDRQGDRGTVERPTPRCDGRGWRRRSSVRRRRELIPAEQLDVGVLRSAGDDLDVGIEARDEASADGRPGDRDDRRIVALAGRTQPHRDDRRWLRGRPRRRRRRSTSACRCARPTRRACRATGRRWRRTGRRPPRTGGSGARSRGRTPQPPHRLS